MKNKFLLFLTACALLVVTSCQQELVEPTPNDLQSLTQSVPAETEDVEQYITDDEAFSKAKISAELLAAVDAYHAQNPTEEVDFRMGCDVACEGVAGDVIFCEDFDNRMNGDVSENSPHFEKWNPDAQNDGQIVTGFPNKFLKIDRTIQSQDYDLNEQDDILILNADQGCYNLHFEMYIGSCRTAYFDLQKQSREETLASFQFNKFGKAFATFPNGQVVHFNYPVGQWFDVDLRFNINTLPFNPTPPLNMLDIPNENTMVVEIAGRTLGTISTEENIFNIANTTSNQLDGVDFYPFARSSKFYVDNVCFTYLGDPALGGD